MFRYCVDKIRRIETPSFCLNPCLRIALILKESFTHKLKPRGNGGFGNANELRKLALCFMLQTLRAMEPGEQDATPANLFHVGGPIA